MKTKTKQIPIPLFEQMRAAIRAGARDSRKDDRVLHDETRELLVQANDALTDWQDSRSR